MTGAINEAAEAAAAKSVASLTPRFFVFHFPLISDVIVVGLETTADGVKTPVFVSDFIGVGNTIGRRD